MNYYTKQEMDGGMRYTGKCRIGNWNENDTMDEAQPRGGEAEGLARRRNQGGRAAGERRTEGVERGDGGVRDGEHGVDGHDVRGRGAEDIAVAERRLVHSREGRPERLIVGVVLRERTSGRSSKASSVDGTEAPSGRAGEERRRRGGRRGGGVDGAQRARARAERVTYSSRRHRRGASSRSDERGLTPRARYFQLAMADELQKSASRSLLRF
eukprot:31361-Pelagococcus_subviridis.AAC.5